MEVLFGFILSASHITIYYRLQQTKTIRDRATDDWHLGRPILFETAPSILGHLASLTPEY